MNPLYIINHNLLKNFFLDRQKNELFEFVYDLFKKKTFQIQLYVMLCYKIGMKIKVDKQDLQINIPL